MEIKNRVKEIMQAEADAINAIPVTDEYAKAIDIIKNCKGKVITTGIGKAGLIARKLAATLCSTATPAAFLHPAESAHGDLGIIDSKDCIIALSTSGKSNEVIEMLELSKHLGVKNIIGITSHVDSILRRYSDVVLDMGIIKEPCPHGLTPSASIAAMLAICDAIAIVLMEIKGVTKHEYGLRHHGGYLGKQSRTDNT
ncbi:MAG: SIS domain-containing protein [Spirochaetes bacterium]|nr:SIS domain-containing protein [Spirochaetota bacterium]